MKVVLIILAIGLVPLLLFHITRVFRAVPLADLHNYVGKSRKVEVTISRVTTKSIGEVVLYVSNDFRLVIPVSRVSKFPNNPELYYPGKTLRVTETIRQDEEGYFMELESRQQISEL